MPTEGLYAEALRRPGLVEALQREHRVTLAGPTTLLATLNSLQMGFRTLALEKRSAEVWEVLGAVKTEFGKFGDVLAKTKKKLDEASQLDRGRRARTRVMARQLRDVEALPEDARRRCCRALALDDETAEEPRQRSAVAELERLMARQPHAARADRRPDRACTRAWPACAWPRRCWRCSRATRHGRWAC